MPPALTAGVTRFEMPQEPQRIRAWVDVFSAVIQISADTPVDPVWWAVFKPALYDAISQDPVLATAQSPVSMLMALNVGECEETLAISRLAIQPKARSRADKAAIFVCLHRASALMARAAIADGGKLAADHTDADSYEMVSCQIHAGLCAFEPAQSAEARALLEPCDSHLALIHGGPRNWLEYFAALAELSFQSKGYRGAQHWIERGAEFARQRNQPQLALGMALVQVELLHRAGQTEIARQHFDRLAADLQGPAPVPPKIRDLAHLLELELLLSEGKLGEANGLSDRLTRTAIAAADLRLDLGSTRQHWSWRGLRKTGRQWRH